MYAAIEWRRQCRRDKSTYRNDVKDAHRSKELEGVNEDSNGEKERASEREIQVIESERVEKHKCLISK